MPNDKKMNDINLNEIEKSALNLNDPNEKFLQEINNDTINKNSLSITESGIDKIGEMTTITILLDNSGSMSSYTGTIIDAFEKIFLPPMKRSKEASKILLNLVFFGDTVQASGYRKLDDVPYRSYSCNGGTALYDAISVSVSSLLSYIESVENNGISTRNIFIIITDGQDNASLESTISSAKIAIEKLNKREYIVSYIAFGQGSVQTGLNLGLSENNPKQINIIEDMDEQKFKNMLGLISKSAILGSQGAIGVEDDFFNVENLNDSQNFNQEVFNDSNDENNNDKDDILP